MNKSISDIWKDLFLKKVTEEFIEYADKTFGKPFGTTQLCQTQRFASYYKCWCASRGIII